MNKKTSIYIFLGLVFIAFVIWLIKTPGNQTPSKYDEFAMCLKDKGALFYGAFWCPHCQNQKALFGRASKYLPYVECSNPDGKTQNTACNDVKIESYPTWVFSNGTRVTGNQTLEYLAEQTSCILPQE